METTDKKILITGGHLTPAYITATHLQSKGYRNIYWVGRKYTQTGDTATSPEFQLVNELKIPFIHLVAGKLWRRWNKYTYFTAIKDLLLIPVGIVRSIFIIFKQKPDLVISFGGYVALPVVIAAKLMFKKVITHEQVLTPGLANKIIATLSDKVMISWEQSKKYFPERKTVLTGNPSWVDYNKTESNEISFENDLPIITFIGGNQGAHVINTAVFAILPELLRVANVIHQTGRSEVTGDKYKASEIKSQLSNILGPRYVFQPYIIDNIYEIFDKSDLIVTRGGANTMTDVILKAKKSIVIPIPWSSGGEQLKNAKYLKSLGLADIVEYENEINPEELLSKIKAMLKKEDISRTDKIKKLQTRIRYSASKIVKVVEEILKD